MRKSVLIVSIALGTCFVAILLAGGIFLATNMSSLEYSEGYYLAQKGHYKEAIEKFTSVISRDPHYVAAYSARADIYAELGEKDKAIEDYSKAIEFDRPPNSEDYANRGDAYGEMKLYQQAIDDYTKAIQLDSKYARAYNNRAVIYDILKQYKKAEEDASQCVTLDPHMDEGWAKLGNARTGLDLSDKALTAYNQAIKLAPDDERHYYNRSSYLIRNQLNHIIIALSLMKS